MITLLYKYLNNSSFEYYLYEILFIGFLDDLILLPMLIAITVKFIPKEILNQCRVEAENIWNNGRPKKWYFSIPIILIWIALLVKLFII